MARGRLWIIGCTLAASVALNVLVCHSLWDFYREIQWLRLHPTGWDTSDWTPRVGGDHDPCQAVVLLLGDSRIAQWDPLPVIQGFRVVNAGVPGATTAQLMLAADFLMDRVSPSVVVLQIGINDLKTIGIFPQDRDAIVRSCVDNIKTMAERIDRRGCRLVVLSVLSPGRPEWQRRWVWSDAIYIAVQEVNDRLKDLLSTHVAFVDCGTVLSEHGRIRRAYAVDCLHLNRAGYEAMNQYLGSNLDSLFR